MEEPNKLEVKRNSDGTFAKGTPPPNPAGRPKGQTLKEYWREKFMSMSEEEKDEFSKKVGFDMIWRMAEGNPKQDTDMTSGGEKIQFNLITYSEDNNNSTSVQTEGLSVGLPESTTEV